MLLPKELPVGLHVGLIMDGLQDGLLLSHLLGLGDDELCLRHVEPQSRLIRLVFLRIRHLHASVCCFPSSSSDCCSSFSDSDESGSSPTTMQVARLAWISSLTYLQRFGVSIA
ncbi:Cytochrome P450 87A3 [Hordeum vulgare]|nr:Cytochrome P450 87A3 [Hordeum vulgare]